MRDDPHRRPVAHSLALLAALESLPQGSNPNGEVSFANSVLAPSALEDLSPEGLQRSRTGHSAIAGRNCYSAPPAPTLASAIFTPGPIVELMEIFFK